MYFVSNWLLNQIPKHWQSVCLSICFTLCQWVSVRLSQSVCPSLSLIVTHSLTHSLTPLHSLNVPTYPVLLYLSRYLPTFFIYFCFHFYVFMLINHCFAGILHWVSGEREWLSFDLVLVFFFFWLEQFLSLPWCMYCLPSSSLAPPACNESTHI